MTIAYRGLQQVTSVSIMITIAFIIPEIIVRIWKDYLINLGISIWLSFRIRNFLQMKANFKEDEELVFRYNKAIKKNYYRCSKYKRCIYYKTS